MKNAFMKAFKIPVIKSKSKGSAISQLNAEEKEELERKRKKRQRKSIQRIKNNFFFKEAKFFGN